MVFDRSSFLGFAATLAAAVLLGLVAFDVPFFKSVYFLRAVIPQNGQTVTLDFGVLGFCGSVNGGPLNCTAAHVGYEIDPNILFDNKTFINLPIVIVKWLTSALVIHVVAFFIALVSLAFATLSMIRLPLSCCSSLLNGFAGAVAFVAFIFDLVFFEAIKHQLNKEFQQGSAVIGNAIIMTIIAWLLLFLSPCLFLIGKCCCVGGRGKY